MNKVNIRNLNKAEVLLALYEGSRPMGMGLLAKREQPLTVEDYEKLLEKDTYFDYLYGRPLKVNLEGDKLCTILYNRDNGPMKAERLIALLRAKDVPRPGTYTSTMGVLYTVEKTVNRDEIQYKIKARFDNDKIFQTDFTITTIDLALFLESNSLKEYLRHGVYEGFCEIADQIIQEMEKENRE